VTPCVTSIDQYETWKAEGMVTFAARDPRTGAVLGEYEESTPEQVAAVCAAAADAFAATQLARSPPGVRSS
jgi:acyl-CoA reductase-like NAD-dependent aldehyde dehydrogenase